MSEPFTAVEEMIRCLAKDVNPAVSLRQRVLTASRIARERHLSRIRIRRTSCWVLMCLCLIYCGAQVQWDYFQTPGGPNGSELSASRGRAVSDSQSSAVSDSQGSMGSERTVIISRAEESSPIINDPIEWETAESHWKRRDRQSTLISHYF